MLFRDRPRSLPQIFGDGAVKMGEATVNYGQIGGIVVAALTLGAMIIWMRSSRSGLQMRAMMMNPLGAAVVGVSVRTTGMRVLAISGALTGLSAVLLGQVFFVSPTSGVTPLTVGLIISLAGGLGSIPGTVPKIGPAFEGCGFRERCEFADESCKRAVPRRKAGATHDYLCRLAS